MNRCDECTLDHPKPFIVDRTRNVDKFWNDIHGLDLKRILAEELNSEKTSLIPDVLCPWGCTEFCCSEVRTPAHHSPRYPRYHSTITPPAPNPLIKLPSCQLPPPPPAHHLSHPRPIELLLVPLFRPLLLPSLSVFLRFFPRHRRCP
jgi:hypothetical protein